jgi:hypothetical protein
VGVQIVWMKNAELTMFISYLVFGSKCSRNMLQTWSGSIQLRISSNGVLLCRMHKWKGTSGKTEQILTSQENLCFVKQKTLQSYVDA